MQTKKTIAFAMKSLALLAVKSAYADEIFGCASDEIKSVPLFLRSRISSRSDFIHRRWIYSVRKDGFR